MRNLYHVDGDVVFIELNSKKHGKMTTMISLCDLDRAKEMPFTWYPKYSIKNDSYYVAANIYLDGGRRTTVKLHRWVMNPPDDDIYVDHINHDTLNNRRSNLRLVTNAQNQYNRKGSNKQNETGVLGVSYRPDIGKYRARVYKDRVPVFNQTFECLKEAEKAVAKARKKYFGKYA